MKRIDLSTKDGFWRRISIKFLVIFVVLMGSHIIGFVIVEQNFYEREINNLRNYEYDITKAEFVYLSLHIQRVVSTTV